MLIALAGILFVFFGASSLNERIESAVDPARVEQALAHSTPLVELRARLDAEIEATSERLREVHRRHDAYPEDYERALAPLHQLRKEAVMRLLVEREALRELLSEEEWAQVFPPPPER